MSVLHSLDISPINFDLEHGSGLIDKPRSAHSFGIQTVQSMLCLHTGARNMVLPLKENTQRQGHLQQTDLLGSNGNFDTTGQ